MMKYEGRIPPRIAKLRIDARGYPVPWFVQWFDGKPDFRVVDERKLPRAIKQHLCWICGDVFAAGEESAFVIGPMCSVNRISAEPPLHLECAEFSVRACPFLSLPNAKRREANYPGEPMHEVGIMHPRNPGVTLIWICPTFIPFRAPAFPSRHGSGGAVNDFGWLFELGDPTAVRWYREGRLATRAEAIDALDSGTVILREAAKHDGAVAECSLNYWRDEVNRLLPAELPEPADELRA